MRFWKRDESRGLRNSFKMFPDDFSLEPLVSGSIDIASWKALSENTPKNLNFLANFVLKLALEFYEGWRKSSETDGSKKNTPRNCSVKAESFQLVPDFQEACNSTQQCPKNDSSLHGRWRHRTWGHAILGDCKWKSMAWIITQPSFILVGWLKKKFEPNLCARKEAFYASKILKKSSKNEPKISEIELRTLPLKSQLRNSNWRWWRHERVYYFLKAFSKLRRDNPKYPTLNK